MTPGQEFSSVFIPAGLRGSIAVWLSRCVSHAGAPKFVLKLVPLGVIGRWLVRPV